LAPLVAEDALERAGDWFLCSGIQEPSGGVARYYRSDWGRNARISTEITGYAVTFLMYVYRRTGQAKYLDSALRAARFLTRQTWDRELLLFPFELSPELSMPGAAPTPPAYFFDSGIVARGLLAAWRVTQDDEFLDVAISTGRGMIEHFRVANQLAPILLLPSRQPMPYEPRWSASPGCYQLKSAMAWQDLFEITGDSAFHQAYEDALKSALASHASFLPGDPVPERVMDRLHAYLYFLEGLLPVADRPECRAAMQQGMVRVALYLRKIAPQFARSDVYAQLLRVRLFCSSLGIVAMDARAAEEEASATEGFRFYTGGERFTGGFGFGLQSGREMPFVNPVSTAFCGQALDMWRQCRAGGLTLDRHLLV